MKTNIKSCYFYCLLIPCILTLPKNVEAELFTILLTTVIAATIGAGSTALGAWIAGGDNSADGNILKLNTFHNNGDQIVNINPATPIEAARDLAAVGAVCAVGSGVGYKLCGFYHRYINNSNAQNLNNKSEKEDDNIITMDTEDT